MEPEEVCASKFCINVGVNVLRWVCARSSFAFESNCVLFEFIGRVFDRLSN